MPRALEGVREERAVPMYASQEARDGDIEKLSGADPAVLRDRLLAVDHGHPRRRGGAPRRPLDGDRIERTPGSDRTFTAGRVGEMRLREVEIHHADLDLAYTWADWPSDFTALLLDGRGRIHDGPPLHGVRRRPGPLVGRSARARAHGRGPGAALAWWATGRDPGEGLTSDDGDVPRMEAW